MRAGTGHDKREVIFTMKSKDKSGGKKPERKRKEGAVPGTFPNQNLGHNSKKEGLGPNTGR
jgi:hypothetical protein